MNTPITPRVCGIGDEAAPDLDGQIRVHRDLGWTALELRTIAGTGVCDLDADTIRAVADRLAAAGLTVPVLDTPLGGWGVTVAVDFAGELALIGRAIRNARGLGCDRLRVMSYPNAGLSESDWRAESLRRLRELTRIAADSGVVLLHENCHGWAGSSGEHSVELVTEISSPALRLLFDTGNGLAYGYPTLPFLRDVLPWVDHVHVKDGRPGPGTAAVFGMPGEGDADLVACLRLLADSGYAGWYSIEPHVAHIPHLGVTDRPERLAPAYTEYGERFVRLAAAVDREQRDG